MDHFTRHDACTVGSSSRDRRCQSEPWATPLDHSGNNTYVLAKIAARQLLSGCMPVVPRERLVSKKCHSVDWYNGKTAGLPRRALNVVSTMGAQVHPDGFSSGRHSNSLASFDKASFAYQDDLDSITTTHGGSSDDDAHSSDELDCRLQTMKEALCPNISKRDRRQRRVHPSEVSRTQDTPDAWHDKTPFAVQAGTRRPSGVWHTAVCTDLSNRSDTTSLGGEPMDAPSGVNKNAHCPSYSVRPRLWLT